MEGRHKSQRENPRKEAKGRSQEEKSDAEEVKKQREKRWSENQRVNVQPVHTSDAVKPREMSPDARLWARDDRGNEPVRRNLGGKKRKRYKETYLIIIGVRKGTDPTANCEPSIVLLIGSREEVTWHRGGENAKPPRFDIILWNVLIIGDVGGIELPRDNSERIVNLCFLGIPSPGIKKDFFHRAGFGRRELGCVPAILDFVASVVKDLAPVAVDGWWLGHETWVGEESEGKKVRMEAGRGRVAKW